MGDSEKEPINKLVLQWLQEWKNDCSKIGSKMEFVYLRAIKSLREHKDPVYSAEDLKKLKFFGVKTCDKLKKRLAEHFGEAIMETDDIACSSQTSQVSLVSMASSQGTDTWSDLPVSSSQESRTVSPKKRAASRKKTDRKYVPRYRSGGFAILVALFRADIEENFDTLNKNDIIQRAQRYADEPMANHNTGYSSWSSMSTLIKHGYVEVKKSRFPCYSLTEVGREVASKLFTAEENQENQVAPGVSSGGSTVLHAQNFDLYLLIDSREQYSAGCNETRKTGVLNEFTERDIKCKMVKLPVGDFAWMARERVSLEDSRANAVVRQELLLDYVIERKRYDDLASSIKDGRWHEQKYRLLHSGVRHPIYLIEDFGSHRKQEGLYNCMHQSIMDTMIIDNCTVKQTRNYAETIDFLALMTKYLESVYRNRTLYSCTKEAIISGAVGTDHFLTINEFNLSADKITNFTVNEMFIKHLLKFKGLSVSKAKSITDIYPTLACLIEAYDKCDSLQEKELLLSEILYGNCQRKIGPTLSRKIYKFYSASFL